MPTVPHMTGCMVVLACDKATGFLKGWCWISTPYRINTSKPIAKKFVTGDNVAEQGCSHGSKVGGPWCTKPQCRGLGQQDAKGIKRVGNGEGYTPPSSPSGIQSRAPAKINFVQPECQKGHLVARIALNFLNKQLLSAMPGTTSESTYITCNTLCMYLYFYFKHKTYRTAYTDMLTKTHKKEKNRNNSDNQ